MARFLEIMTKDCLFGSEIVYVFLTEEAATDPVKLKAACEKLGSFTLTHDKQKKLLGWSSSSMQVYTSDAPEDLRQEFLVSLGIQDQNALKRIYLTRLKELHPEAASMCDALLAEKEDGDTWKPYLLSDMFPMAVEVIGFRTDDRKFEYRF